MSAVAERATSEVSRPLTIPTLENGDHLTRAEFEAMYRSWPDDKKAELIEGVVYVASPVRLTLHGQQTSDLSLWLGTYRVNTPGTHQGDNSTVRLDQDNEPQPDVLLRLLPEHGGQSTVDDEGYLVGAPELAAEVSVSTRSIDLHSKMNAYRRNRVLEYLVWRVEDKEIDWFVWREGRYQRLSPDSAGVYKSEVFPGLWLDAPALLAGDMAKVLAVLQEGLASPEHAAFVAGRPA